jgi:hypothetical protein
MLEDGKWVPTFPNARYLGGRIVRANGEFRFEPSTRS